LLYPALFRVQCYSEIYHLRQKFKKMFYFICRLDITTFAN